MPTSNCPECKKTFNLQEMYMTLCCILNDIKTYFLTPKTEYNTPSVELVEIGGSITLDSNDFHSITITVIEECDSITINGETITNVPAGYSFSYTASSLLSAEIEVDCATKGKVIINTIN